MTENSVPRKTCRTCGQTLPATSEYFYKSRSSLALDCKSCANKKTAAQRKADPEKRERHKAQQQAYHQRNKEKRNQRTRQWRLQNIEYVRQFDRDRYNKGRKEYNRKWRLLNNDRSRELARKSYYRHVEKRRAEARRATANNPERSRRWRALNVEAVRAMKQRREAKKRLLPNDLTAEQWKRAIEYFHGCCAYCGRPAGLWHTISMDHFIPISSGGGTTVLNVVPCCFAKKDGTDGCNSSKGNTLAEKWLIRKFGQRRATEILKRIEDYFEWVKLQE